MVGKRSTNANPESLVGKARLGVDHPLSTVGKRGLRRATAIPVPTTCMMMNIGAEDGSSILQAYSILVLLVNVQFSCFSK